MTENTSAIELRGVSRSYRGIDKAPDLIALDDVSFTVKRGSFTCIIGESGCGKTSMLRMIAGLDSPTGGDVYIDGEAVKGPGSKCGMVFQQSALFPWLTVRENVAFGLRRTGKYNESPGEVDELLKKVRIEAFSDSYPAQLSGGMQQRVALARALALRPEIMLLDEPLSALDAFTRMKLQDELLSLWRMQNNTVLMVTHDIEEAIYLSDTIIVMTPRPGRIKAVIDNDMEYPRNRASEAFVRLRNELLTDLNFSGQNSADAS